MSPEALFQEQLPLIERIAARVCRRAGVFDADAEDFASAAKLALIENGYAILRAFEGRSSLATYLAIVLDRMLMDELTRVIGKWHPSSEARRLGEAAVMLETIVVRDGRSIEEALPLVTAVDPLFTAKRAEEILARLPPRTRRPRAVDLPERAEELFVAPDTAEGRALEAEAARMARRTEDVMRATLASFDMEERMLIRFRFGSGMSVADIARMMNLPQRPLYRRLEALLARMHAELRAAGIEAPASGDLDLGLQTAETRPTNESEARS